MPFLRKYGTGTGADVIIPMIKAGVVDHAVSADWTPAAGDVKISKDGGAAANITTLPTYITSIGWKFVFSDAELQAARINVQVTDSATKAVEDQHFVIETYGNASAQHAVDLDDSVRAGLTALPNAAADAAGGLPISDAGGLDLDAMNTNVSSILTDTGTTLDNHLTDIKGTGFAKDTHSLTNIEGYVDLIDDGTSGLAKIATDAAAILVDTGSTLPTSLTAIETDTQDIQSKIGTPSDLGGGATLAANNSDMAGATFSAATDSQEAIRDNLSSGSSPQLLQNTTIATLATQTSFTLTAGSADNDAYNGAVAIFTDQTTGTQKAFVSISDYVGSTKTVTLSAAPAFTIATGDTIDIVASASDAPTAAAIRAEIDSNSTQLAAIVADTSELQGDWTNGGRLDLIIDELTTQGDTNEAAITALNDPTAAAIADAVWDEAKAGHVAAGSFGEEVQAHALTSEVAAVETDTQDIQSRLPAALVGGRIDATVDATGMESGATAAIRDAILDRLLAGNHDTDGTVGFILQLLQADRYTDTSVTPWDLVYMKRGTGGIGVGTELLRHNLTQSDASNVTSTSHVVANAIE